MNKVVLRALLPAVLLLALQGSALAQSTWTGNSSAAWNTAGNWDPAAVPGVNASVTVDINSVLVYTLQVNTSPTLTNWSSNITGNTTIIRASGNQTLSIAGVLTKTGAASLTFRSNLTDKLTMTAGTLNLTDSVGSTITLGTTNNELSSLDITTANVSSASGTNQLVFLGANNTADYRIGTLNLGTNGTVVIANGVANGEQRAINVGSLNGAGGTVRAANGITNAGVATLNLTGTSDGSYSGTIINGNAITRLVKSGSATQTLSGNNTYTGGSTLTAGTLVLAHNSAAGTAGIAVSGSSAAALQINSGITLGNNIVFSNSNSGSSLNRLVANTADYTVGTSGSFTSSFAGGDADTTAKILAGTNSQGSTATLTMKFSDTSTATNDTIRTSDVFSLGGTASNAFVLQLSYTGLAAGGFLGWDNAGTWVNAVDGNTGPAGALAGAYTTSFATFLANNGGIFNGTTMLGAYGVDTTAGSTWAVLNHNSDFAVVPEPSTWALLAGSLTFVMVMRRRRRD